MPDRPQDLLVLADVVRSGAGVQVAVQRRDEEFDLLIPEEHATLPAVQALLEATASERFRSRVLALGGYRFR
jgi:hypothetical protein